jgi:hypothetical protein
MNRPGKGQSQRPFADAFGTKKKIGVVQSPSGQGRAQDLQLFSVSDDVSKAH